MNKIKTAAGGLIITANTHRALFNIRSPHKTHNLTWSLWGGMISDNETPSQCLYREMKEEMGFLPSVIKTYPFDVYKSPDRRFMYHTFICVVEKEFAPWISSENCGYCWMDIGIWPKPMHYGAKKTLCTKESLDRLRLILSRH